MEKERVLLTTWRTDALIGIVVCAVYGVVLAFAGVVPFGDKTLAGNDAFNQYMDFFLYYKRVLAGDDSFLYSLSAGLGQGNISLFAYYLASPFNLLLLLIKTGNIQLFFSIAAVIKTGIAATCMSFFLRRRFDNSLDVIFLSAFSLGYACMGYSFSQALNPMWLDGVYLLPLILLGTYYAAKGNSCMLLAVSIGVSILFNWYTAGINCLFSGIWFLLEVYLADCDDRTTWYEKGKNLGRYVIGGLCGVLLSMPLFLPTVLSLREGVGSFDWSLMTNTLRGSILTTIPAYSIGCVSTIDTAALFTGSLTLICACGALVLRSIKWRKRVALGLLLCFSVIIYYWQPAFLAFSLFKDATSMWYRYAYVSSFALVFVASVWATQKKENRTGFHITVIALLIAAVVIVSGNVLHFDGGAGIRLTCCMLIAQGVLLGVNLESQGKRALITAVFLGALIFIEGVLNGAAIIEKIDIGSVEKINKYNASEERQIAAVKDLDSSAYRLSQTSNMRVGVGNMSAKYNESLAFGYWGIASYTSSTKANSVALLDRMGYRNVLDRSNVVNTSIVPSDSLLGVKYVLSAYDIKGYESVPGLPEVDYRDTISLVEQKNSSNRLKMMEHGKSVFRNPYAVPLAYTSNEKLELTKEYNGNPFEYINQVYSVLYGEKIEVFKQAEYTMTVESDDEQGTYTEIEVTGIPADNPAYGNIPWKSDAEAEIQVTDRYTQNYASWFSPSVFYIPMKKKDTTIHITGEGIAQLKDPQIYYCDLNALRKVTDQIKGAEASIHVADNQQTIRVKKDNAKKGEHLIISVPTEKGWRASVNGHSAKIGAFAGALMEIELDQGFNEVELKYTVPGMKAGVAAAILGLFLLVLMVLFEKKRWDIMCLSGGKKTE